MIYFVFSLFLSHTHTYILTKKQVVQLEELLAVRHSIFIVGEEGTGKSQIWKTLHSTYIQQERKPIVYDLNPKCMSNNELFGMYSATREWKDGLLSTLIRDQAKYVNDNPKWIIIDGPIDPLLVSNSLHFFTVVLLALLYISYGQILSGLNSRLISFQKFMLSFSNKNVLAGSKA